MTTNPMLAELDAVVRLSNEADRLPYGEGKAYAYRDATVRALNFVLDYHATLADMAKRLEAAGRDAARYRWLRECSYGQHDHPICVSQNKRMLMGERIGNLYVGPLIGVALDKALDAAIDATQEGEG